MDTKEQIRTSLIKSITKRGFPLGFAVMIADSLGTEKQMQRMVSWIIQMKPDTPEMIADEMLSIKAEFEKYKNKAIAEYANRKYNEILNCGLESSDLPPV